MKRRREITGSHPAYKPAAGPSGSCGCAQGACRHAKGSAGIAELTSEADAAGYWPSNPELVAMGVSRDLWDASSPADRLRFARAAGGAAGPDRTGGSAEQAARQATLDEDEAAFQRALAQVPEGDRARVLEQHLRARGASEEAVRAGLFALARQGLAGLSSWLNSDLDRDLERIRSASATEQARIREEQETARAEITAATERYRIDHAGGAANPPPPAAPGNGTNLLLGLGLVLALAGIVALTSRKG